MALLLFVLFIVVPIAELYVLIQIGQAIGVLPTIALLIADSVLGAALMRAQGRAAWLRFNAALAEGRVPGREVMDGALVIFGGALLLTPGFLSDFLGLILLLPPTRALVRGILVKRFADRLVASAASGAQTRVFGFGRPPGRRARGRRRSVRRRRRLERDRRRPAAHGAAVTITADDDRLHEPPTPDSSFRDAVTFSFGDPAAKLYGLARLSQRLRRLRAAGGAVRRQPAGRRERERKCGRAA